MTSLRLGGLIANHYESDESGSPIPGELGVRRGVELPGWTPARPGRAEQVPEWGPNNESRVPISCGVGIRPRARAYFSCSPGRQSLL